MALSRNRRRQLLSGNGLQIAALEYGRISEPPRFLAHGRVLDGRLGDPPLPRPLQSRMCYREFLAQVPKPQVFVSARRCSI